MTSFLWKRKAGGNISKETSKNFEANSKPDGEDLSDCEVDWISLAPRRKVICLEDAAVKSNRLKQEGVTLAEAERYWEAIQKWNQALQLTPSNEKLYEMKAQALLLLNEVHPSLSAAQKCVELNGSWWVGHQTLGRVHLALGEVRSALRSFCVALHLNPADEELRSEDLDWTFNLLQQKLLVERELKERELKPTIVEVETHEDNSESSVPHPMNADDGRLSSNSNSTHDEILTRVPTNYVLFRD